MQSTRAALAAIGLSVLSGTAVAQSARTVYDVSHPISVHLPGANTAEVRAFTFRHARLGSGGVMDEDHAPAAQDPGFDPWGREIFFASTSPAWNTGLAGPVQVIYDDFVIINFDNNN